MSSASVDIVFSLVSLGRWWREDGLGSEMWGCTASGIVVCLRAVYITLVDEDASLV